MAYEIGFVDDLGSEGIAHHQMLEKIRRFATGYGTYLAPTYAGTGNGTMTAVDTFVDTITETWTIACITAAVNGGTFSVTGSVSGAQANAVVGTPYANTKIKFTINDGSVDFIVGDTFTIVTTLGALPVAQRWTTLRYDTTLASRELILQGVGLSGVDEIFIGFRTYESVAADYYNLSVAGFIGYTPGNTFTSQPGYVESGMPAHNQRIDYWLIVNAQRIAFVLKVGTPVYESAYIGKMLPYASPSQYPYPLVVGGMLVAQAATRYSDTAHTMSFKGNRANLKMRWLDGTYKQPLTYPWSNAYVGGASAQLRDTNDNYPILPIVLYETAPNVFGELDGVGYVSNFNNTVESVVQVGGTPVVDNGAWTAQQRVDAIVAAGGVAHACFQDATRTSFNDYFSLRLN